MRPGTVWLPAGAPASGHVRAGSVSIRFPSRLHACVMLPGYQGGQWWSRHVGGLRGLGHLPVGWFMAEPTVAVAHREHPWWLFAAAAQWPAPSAP